MNYMMSGQGLCSPGDLGGAEGGRDELKTQFMTREGLYRLMTLEDYSRPSRVGYANQQGTGSTPVKVSFVGCGNSEEEKIAFNYGRELFVYPYRGVRKGQEAKVLDKRVYKGTSPTSHDFGPPGCLRTEKPDIIPLLVGFTGGQVHLIDPVHKELSRLYNEERLVDKTKVTCIKWAPGRGDMFVVSHSSGYIYTYLADTECTPVLPQYQVTRQGTGYTYYTCKSKPPKNPISRLFVNGSCINEFAFSPCGQFLATVSQDGVLRVFNFETMELIGSARSYFGGLLCCAWSPDGRYIVVGGEDDLIAVYGIQEKRVVARGQGHRSWVSVVTFDLYNLAYGDIPDGLDFSGSEEEVGLGLPQSINSPPPTPRLQAEKGCVSSSPPRVARGTRVRQGEEGDTPINSENQRPMLPGERRGAEDEDRRRRKVSCRDSAVEDHNVTCYRFGSVGQDTMLCLWDLTEDILKLSQSMVKCKTKSKDEASSVSSKDSGLVADNGSSGTGSVSSEKPSSSSSLSQKLSTLNFSSPHSKDNAGHKRAFSLPGRGEKKEGAGKGGRDTGGRSQGFPDTAVQDTLGSPGCPRLHETPVLEPAVMKKIAHERLTALIFREECIVTACQEGYVCTWARPGHLTATHHHHQHGQPSPGTTHRTMADTGFAGSNHSGNPETGNGTGMPAGNGMSSRTGTLTVTGAGPVKDTETGIVSVSGTGDATQQATVAGGGARVGAGAAVPRASPGAGTVTVV